MVSKRDAAFKFAAVQFPIADLRNLSSEGNKLQRPWWPEPTVGSDFIRSLGLIRPRPRGNPLWVEGEGSFIEVAGRLPITGGPAVRYARVFGTAAGYRLDVGFRLGHSGGVAKIARSIADATIEIDGRHHPLLRSHNALATFIAKRTSRHGGVPKYGMVSGGRPLIMIEGGARGAVDCLHARTVALDEYVAVSVWALSLQKGKLESNRQLRAAIWRLYYEHSVLASVLAKRHQTDSVMLLDYLEHTTRILARGRRGGVDQNSLRSIARRAGGWDISELDHALEYIRGQSKGIARRIELMLERSTLMHSAASVGYIENLEVIVGDKIRAGKNAQIINRSANASAVNKSAGASVNIDVVSEEVRSEIESVLNDHLVASDAAAAKVAEDLRTELQGEARVPLLKVLWQKLRETSPVVGALVATASLANNVLG